MSREKEDRVAKFKETMRNEFANIPENLSIEDYLDRAERYSSMSLNAHQEGDIFKAKRFELLSLKYKQIAQEKKNPKPKVEVKEIPPVKAEEKLVEKVKWYHKVFKIFSSGKEVTIEETAEIKEEEK